MRPRCAVVACLALWAVPGFAQEEKEPSATYLLSKIDNYKPPVYEEPKDDLSYRRIWVMGFLRYLEKKNDLIWEFVKRYPEHERARPLMEEWYKNLGGGTVPCINERIPKAILAIDTLLVNQPPDWVKSMGQFYRAYYALCGPWNRLVQLDGMGAAADDSERRDVVNYGMAAIASFTSLHPKDFRAAKLYDILATASHDPVSARAIYAKVVDEYPDHPNLALFKGKMHRYDRLEEPFEMEFEDALTGAKVTAQDYKGKVLLIVFWTTGLQASEAHIKEAKRLWMRYNPEGLEVVDVSLDQLDKSGGKKTYVDYVNDHKLEWRHLYDGAGWNGAFAKTWGVNELPMAFLVDRRGVLRYVDGDQATESKIKALLKEK